METNQPADEFVLGTIASLSNRQRHEIGEGTRLIDIGMDSMMLMALVAQIEASYAAELSPPQVLELFAMETVRDVVAFVRELTEPVAEVGT